MIDQILFYRIDRGQPERELLLLIMSKIHKNNRNKFNLFSYSLFFGSIHHILGKQYVKETT